MSDRAIGTREFGKRNRMERWYHCAIMDEVVPESETIIPVHPHPHAGFRVCLKHLDELDYGTIRRITPPKIGRHEGGP